MNLFHFVRLAWQIYFVQVLLLLKVTDSSIKREAFPLIFYLAVTVSIRLRSCRVVWSAVVLSLGQYCCERQLD